MDEENYKLLLEQNEKFRQDLEELKTKLKEVTDFNRTLLNTHGSTPNQPSEEDEKAAIWKQLKEDLTHGSH